MKGKTTKRALVTSAVSLLLCVTMLIGTTFAWFTDTASTAVNKIQSGTLNVKLEYATEWDEKTGAPTKWEDAEGKTLNFKKAAGHESETILWEPGCTYKLPEIRIANEGNLALKYKINVTGIDGDAKLLEAITWEFAGYATEPDGTYHVGMGGLLDDIGDGEATLKAGNQSNPLVISGHMKEDAGNEYQGLSIDGIAITVVATQVESEFDSYNNTYDANAVYPVVSTIVKATASGTVTDAAAETVITDTEEETDAVIKATLPANTLAANDKVELTVDRTAMTADSVTFEIDLKVNDISKTEALSQPAVVTVNIGKGLKNVSVTHNGVAMTEADDGDQSYSYDATTGILTIRTTTFSPFTFKYETDFEASVGGIGYATLADAIDASISGQTISLQRDITEGDHKDYVVYDLTGKTLDLNGYTFSAYNFDYVFEGTGGCIKNGKMTCLGGGSYALFIGDEGETLSFTVDDVEMVGGINIYNATGVVLKNLDSTVFGTNYYSVWLDEAAEATIESGNYISGDVTVFGATANADCQSVLTVAGGRIEGNGKPLINVNGSKEDCKTGGKLVVENGEFNNISSFIYDKGTDENPLSVTGGRFGIDPSAYLATGYTATAADGTWTVSAQ